MINKKNLNELIEKNKRFMENAEKPTLYIRSSDMDDIPQEVMFREYLVIKERIIKKFEKYNY